MDEEQLVLGLKRRDSAAVEALVASCGDRLFRSACLLCGDPTEAQDLVQDTLLETIRSAHRFQGRSSLYTWLHAILLNLARHHHRKRRRLVYDEQAAQQEVAPMEETPSPADATLSSSALAHALGQLSGPHREVLILRFYENMKVREIATHLGISKGTVKSRLHYALAEMQRLLPNEMNLFGAADTKEIVEQ